MKYPFIFGCTATLIFYGNTAIAKSPAEVEKIVRSVSVEIQVVGSGRVGSGSIVHRQGNLYTLITNRHVACGSRLCKLPPKDTYNLSTSDRQRYRVTVAEVKLIGKDLDLAMIQFRSNRNYPVAQMADPGSLKVRDTVYTAGFPQGQNFLFGSGITQAVVNKRLTGDNGGYTVIYDAETLPGMSGGGAFDKDGRLVAVHGMGDRFTENTEAEEIPSNVAKVEVNEKTGYNRGIPVRWVVRGLGDLGIFIGTTRDRSRVIDPVGATTADEYFIAGFNKMVEPGADFRSGRRDAVAQFSRAIQLNSRYTVAYFMRAYVQKLLQAYPQALADFNQAIRLNPNDAEVYFHRGNLKAQKLNDPRGALADYNQALFLYPKSALTYHNRGIVKGQLNDSQGALADYNQAISLNSQDAIAYYNRGILKHSKLKDFPGALVDYNKAIALKPRFAEAYGNRGLLKAAQLYDFQGALADYDQSISLNPQLAEVYSNRALLKQLILKDRPGAISDYRAAAKIFRQYGQTASLQMVLGQLRELGAAE
jgi:tetratricopeptide (TPR) repeat protein